ncbi:MAG TPA: HNH endonuclease signature motif containing protein [Streptosporangiaceae bacterium]|nr:HNH endonuclease signature motif containing protein [Streptosporangiaceae bacterium]
MTGPRRSAATTPWKKPAAAWPPRAACRTGAGQPTQVQLHLTLDQLRDMPGAAEAQAAWAAQAARAAAEGQSGWLTGRAAGAYACDAAIAPVVTGHIDHAALASLAADLLAQARTGPPGHPAPAALARLHDTLLRHAASLLSGPAGLAAFLRTRLTGGQFPSVSLPLDTGTPTNLITGSLRRAVITRDRHCAFPGCDQPPAACQVHHLQPRAHGGETRLPNLALLCTFHHLIAVHQWGWTLTLHPDGTSTALGPDGRTLHSHGPPSQVA